MDGLVTVLKPPGMSSSDVVVDVRRLFSVKRVGHLGTLDPGAAGVLPVCVGRAARLFPFLVDKDKTYRFEIAFGTATDTQDAFGQVVARSDAVVTEAMLRDALPALTGRIAQKAPAYSALKHNGQKLYDLALAGKEIPDITRDVTVSALTLEEQTDKNLFLLTAVCSRGTYVRTLCQDLGERVGVPAHMRFLLRTKSGSFALSGARSIAELQALRDAGQLETALTPCEDALGFLPAVVLESDRRQPAINGLSSHVGCVADGLCRLYGDGFLGVGAVQNGQAKLKVHLY